MNRKNPSKRPRPSYEEGRVRDPRIEQMQDAAYSKGDLFGLLRRAATKQAPDDAEPPERP